MAKRASAHVSPAQGSGLVQLTLRVLPERRQELLALCDILKQELGTTVSMTQAVEIAVHDLYCRRTGVVRSGSGNLVLDAVPPG